MNKYILFRFKKLAEMYGRESDSEDSQVVNWLNERINWLNNELMNGLSVWKNEWRNCIDWFIKKKIKCPFKPAIYYPLCFCFSVVFFESGGLV